MKNIVLFLSAACLLSAPIFGQQQENRFAEITNPQLLSINKLPPHASFTSYIDETSALNKERNHHRISSLRDIFNFLRSTRMANIWFNSKMKAEIRERMIA